MGSAGKRGINQGPNDWSSSSSVYGLHYSYWGDFDLSDSENRHFSKGFQFILYYYSVIFLIILSGLWLS